MEQHVLCHQIGWRGTPCYKRKRRHPGRSRSSCVWCHQIARTLIIQDTNTNSQWPDSPVSLVLKLKQWICRIPRWYNPGTKSRCPQQKATFSVSVCHCSVAPVTALVTAVGGLICSTESLGQAELYRALPAADAKISSATGLLFFFYFVLPSRLQSLICHL